MTMFPNSARLYAAAGAIAGRSLTRSKAPGRLFDVGTGPLYAVRGDGHSLIDADYGFFVDMICGLGAISLGYGATSAAAVCAVEDGWIYSLPAEMEIRAAERVRTTIAPWATSVRFVKTGSEATHAAYRVAKRATGREFVLVGDWAYHGWHEWCAKRDDGVPESFHTLLYPHGVAFESWLGHGIHPLNVEPEEIAAIFIEPHRWETVSQVWLQDVRRFCDRYGILLVFDEMIYGGRFALGGATSLYGVTPDLACFGKAIGNGAPVACVVGRDVLAQHGELISGTYSGDAAGLAALIETLDVYAREDVVGHLWRVGRTLRDGLDVLVADRSDVVREGAAVHQRLRFVDEARGKRFAAEMAKRGVLWHPQVVNVSFAHDETTIVAVLGHAREAFEALDADDAR